MTVNETSNTGPAPAAAIDQPSVVQKLEKQVAKLSEQVAALAVRTSQSS